MGPLFRLVLDTGLPKGEALALTWRGINFESNPARLTVSKSWSSDGKKAGVMTTPSSAYVRRRAYPTSGSLTCATHTAR